MDTATIKVLQEEVSDKKVYCYRPDEKPDKRTYYLDKGRQELETRLRNFNNDTHAVQPIGLDYIYILLEVIKTILISDIKVDIQGIDEIYLMISDKVVTEMESKKDEIRKVNDSRNMGLRAAGQMPKLIVPGRPIRN